MKDVDIKEFLRQFGDVEGEIIHKTCELGFYNNMRTVIMGKIDFDIKSFISIQGYQIGVNILASLKPADYVIAAST